MISIDGSFGEGGGQIIRTALTLSAITGKKFAIRSIRSKREKKGLMAQHLNSCLAVNKICRGTLKGAEIGSQAFTFEPLTIHGGKYSFDIGTAGSVILLAQTLIPICLYANEATAIYLTGGTHIHKSPNYDYLEQVFLPAILQFGINVRLKLNKVGYYPKGGGNIELHIKPSKLEGISKLKNNNNLLAIIRLSNIPSHVAEREKAVLMQHGFKKIEIYEEGSYSPGNAITLCQGYKGVCALGERGKRAEMVTEEAIAELTKEHAEVDCHLADQLLIYSALAKGKTCFSTSRITEHLRTNIFIISQFLNRSILIEGNKITVT